MTKNPLVVSGPYTHGNLAIFLFHGPDEIDGGGYISLTEAFEDRVAQMGGHARTRILEFDHGAVRFGAQGAADLATGRRELEAHSYPGILRRDGSVA